MIILLTAVPNGNSTKNIKMLGTASIRNVTHISMRMNLRMTTRKKGWTKMNLMMI